MSNQVFGLPRVGTMVSAEYRHVLANMSGAQYLPGSKKVIDASLSRDPLNTGYLSVLRAGLLLGKITASGLYAPSVLGVTTGAYTAGGTSLSASAATVTELVRRVGATGTFTLIGPPTAAGAVAQQAVTYSAASGTTITITALGADAIAGSFIAPDDGSQWPKTIIGDGYGINVTDENSTDWDTEVARLLIAGTVDQAQIINYPSDTSLIAWLKNQLKQDGKFQFLSDF